MKVYLAAMYSLKEDMRRKRDDLKALGIECGSTWLDEPHAPDSNLTDIDPKLMRRYAVEDLADMRRSNLFIGFTVDPTTPTLRGGRHVEFGYALTMGYHVWIVGPYENIFHYLADRRFDTWTEALEALKLEKTMRENSESI